VVKITKQLLQQLRSGQITSKALVEHYLKKIEENAHLNAVIEVNPDALQIAEELDSRKDKSLALFGLPVLIKDNVNTGDKMATSAGSVALAANIAEKDAPIIEHIRNAGAVILGKANMTEFAAYMFDSDAWHNGYSSRGGQCLHPTHPEEDPSGSSTGSAVAVAAGLAPLAVGSETYGSIISPSQHNGIVGIKPTDGLLSKDGILPISFTQDTAGPMATCVEDVTLLLSVMANKTYNLDKQPKDITVGVCNWGLEGGTWPPEEWINAGKLYVNDLKELGVKIVDISDTDIEKIPDVKGLEGFVYPILEYEFQHAINEYLKGQNNPNIPQNLKKIIEYNKQNSEVALKYGQGTLITASKISENWQEEEAYTKALSTQKDVKADLSQLFDNHKIDVLLVLSAHCGLPASVGFPSITVPVGKADMCMPIGICMMARPFDEEVLLNAANFITYAIDEVGDK